MIDDPQAQTLQEHVEWCRRERKEALRQVALFTSGGVRALLQMPEGQQMDITSSVVAHQREFDAQMNRIIEAFGNGRG